MINFVVLFQKNLLKWKILRLISSTNVNHHSPSATAEPTARAVFGIHTHIKYFLTYWNHDRSSEKIFDKFAVLESFAKATQKWHFLIKHSRPLSQSWKCICTIVTAIVNKKSFLILSSVRLAGGKISCITTRSVNSWSAISIVGKHFSEFPQPHMLELACDFQN